MSDTSYRSLTSDICPLVEAPGTAPGSAGFITMAVYRHSRIAPTKANIGTSFADEKALPRSETALAASFAHRVASFSLTAALLPQRCQQGSHKERRAIG